MYSVVGKRKCEGEYEGRAYSHCKLFTISDEVFDGLVGQVVESLKVPMRYFEEVDVGDNVSVNYNRYGKVADVVIL